MIEKAKNFFNKNQEIAENMAQYQYETVVNQENNSPDFKNSRLFTSRYNK